MSCHCFFLQDWQQFRQAFFSFQLGIPQRIYNDLTRSCQNISDTSEKLTSTCLDFDLPVRTLFSEAQDIKLWHLYTTFALSIQAQRNNNYPSISQPEILHRCSIHQITCPYFQQSFRSIWENNGDEGLALYEELREERASRVQTVSVRARTDSSGGIERSSSTERLWNLIVGMVRRQWHKVAGLQGFYALSTLWLEKLVIVPTISPCSSNYYSLKRSPAL